MTYDAAITAVTELLENNTQIEMCRKLLKEFKGASHDLILFLYFCNLWANDNDDNILYSDIENLYDNRLLFARIKRQLYNEEHQLQKMRLIDFNNNDGLVDRESMRVSEHAKDFFFRELSCYYKSSGANKKMLTSHTTISPKDLFYNTREKQGIDELTSLLGAQRFDEICSRLADNGMRKGFACLFYGSPGTGKSRGFVMPFAMQAVKRGESLIMVDPKAEFYEMYSEFLRGQGYTVCAYNLLDLFASDGWNCVTETANDLNLVQNVAEIIIRNTSSESDKDDFWAKAEKNLLMALLHYVGTMTYPGTDKLLPVEERSLGTIYKILSSTSVQELDAKFRSLSPDHPALPPYGIFRQAHKQIWGNIIIGLGNRLNVFQNKLVDDITKHHEIDLTLPGKQKCAYFCIISDQDSSLEFLSSMFFSLLFVKLFDFARSQPNRRLPVCVNVLMDEFCNISLLDSKKIFSVARSRNINIQAAIQSIAQIANRYPKNEWQEIIGDCDYQLFLGCNDMMTAEHISDQCGEITVRINNSVVPMTPLFSPVLNTTRPYTHNKTSTGRPLMMPDEVRRLPKDQAILLIRGSKPLKLSKITPEEHPFFDKLKPCKAIDYEPLWQKQEKQKPKRATGAQSRSVPNYQVKIPIEPEDDTTEEVQLDAEDNAPSKKISYQNAENYNYKKETPKNI